MVLGNIDVGRAEDKRPSGEPVARPCASFGGAALQSSKCGPDTRGICYADFAAFPTSDRVRRDANCVSQCGLS
jgi:hypothetical protein